MDELHKNVIDAKSALDRAVAAARAGGYRVSYQSTNGGDPFPVVDGGPEPIAVVQPILTSDTIIQPAPAPATFGTKPPSI